MVSSLEKFVWIAYRTINISHSRRGRSKELGVSLTTYGALIGNLSFFIKAQSIMNKAVNMLKEVNYEWGLARSLGFYGYLYMWMAGYDNYQKAIGDKFFDRKKYCGLIRVLLALDFRFRGRLSSPPLQSGKFLPT